MVEIRAFCGLRYDTARVDGSAVLAPPYDVVDDAGRAELAARSPYNCAHVILPAGDGDRKYATGAEEFAKLQREALVRDREPSIYVYHQTFELGGETYTRRGFVALVELTRFGEGPILAHERTLAGPKIDRLNLMRACDAHLELVFGLFSDPEHKWQAAVKSALGSPVLDCEYDGCRHQLFRVEDPAACAALVEVLRGRSVYIADGHHRYETMCAFRSELEAQGREGRFGMMYLSNLNDPGLVVLPTHRLVHGLAKVPLADVLAAAQAHFDVSEHPLPRDADALADVLTPAGPGRPTFGLAVPGSRQMHVLSLRANFDPRAAGLADLAPALQRLDVVLLHELVLERGLGITKADQAAKKNLRYYKSTEQAIAVARDGDADTQLVCFMNATPVADVVAVCDSGEVMPQKSTFFYPKIPTGLVFHTLAGGSN